METSTKKMTFPSAFSILFIILLMAIGLTWLIPSGAYSKLSYDNIEKQFIVKTYGNPDQRYPATEQTLNQFNIKNPLPFPILINALHNTKKMPSICSMPWWMAPLKWQILWSLFLS